MLVKFLLGFSILVTLVTANGETKICKEQYTEWEPTTRCTADCGRCGTQTLTRTCQQGCICTGALIKQASCPHRLCIGTAKVCCDGFKRAINFNTKRFECLTKAEKANLDLVQKSMEL